MADFVGLDDLAFIIPNGTNVSNILDAKGVFGDASVLTLFGPVQDVHTFVFEMTYDAIPIATGNWFTWNNGVADISPPVSGKAIQYPLPTATGLRIKDSSGNVAATRTWHTIKRWNAY